ncbi:MAG: class I SAM-dependent methyltransferase [Proteobacteria bacterium]|nr:class I SAM-dependent methyltransferase [Pseudomonadota bacterium]MBU1715575.1 class I SAM-dependent methyltransferase [Pseudomonadota bacterium]
MAVIAEKDLAGILLADVSLQLIEPDLYTVLPEGEISNTFDDGARFYDLVICNPIYNRLIWGYWISSFGTFTQKGLESSQEGLVLDVGCGSLAFNAKQYAHYSARPVVLLDQSLNLLRIAKQRICKINGRVPENMVFVQGDALNLPFKPHVFQTIISLNLLHVLADAKKVLAGQQNVLADIGTISISTLIKNNRFADKYLEIMLDKISGVAPRTMAQLQAVFNELKMPVISELNGNMAFFRYGFK